MPTSEARIRANRENSLRSTGPRTTRGKEQSRRNACTHGMSGAGVVVADCDVPEVERRAAALMAEMDPKSAVGKVLVGQIATLSVRMERGASHELATSASRVRHAFESFDHEREDRVEELFDAIASDPRKHVRLLKRMPEGVDRLIEGWEELRDELTRADGPNWDESHQVLASAMLGYRAGQPGAARVAGPSKSLRGEASGEGAADPAWALELLLELIDQQIAGLEDHRATLDLGAIEQDRAESPDRVLFDFSRDGWRAMRYQSEARRMFFKALKDFRQAEAEAATRPPVPQPQPQPEPIASPGPGRDSGSLGSFRENASPAAREPEACRPADLFPPARRPDDHARGLDGRVLAVGRAVVATG